MARRGRPLYPFNLRTYYGAQLRKRREAAGFTMEELGDKMGYTGSWIGAVELGDEKPSAKFAEDCDTYWNTGTFFHDLQEAIERPNPGRTTIPSVPGFSKYLQHEAEAAFVRKYEALLVAGLLQTEDYIRAVCTSDQRTPRETEAMVRSRLERQGQVLGRDNPPRVFIIQSEHSLRARVAPPDVMKAQYAHLLDLCTRPRIHLQVVPEDLGYHDGRTGSFTVLSFDRGAHDLAYIEAGVHGSVVEDPQAVASFSELYELIRNVAMSTGDTLNLITALMESTP
ncbi:helix-turn-helix domain-containing protein [Actinomadura rayongensis]|uniref:Helix-turn-helix domain-containing protein n=1 Tax=Actinomadura rayongensis TaxID=1429076 RepID=A0A6I4W848_9ACTN|nr:helix-turn-helix transcriptional regulator [Actinomadura rayongensis]MXQ64930.1 helix-turn-helix domain-containing protein [Actinomadura rayongensis]